MPSKMHVKLQLEIQPVHFGCLTGKGFTVLSSTSMTIYPLIRMQTFKEYEYFTLNFSAFVVLINPLERIIVINCK